VNSRFESKSAPVLLLVWLLLSTCAVDAQATDKYKEMINCNLHNGSCSQSLGDSTLVLSVSPRPVKAMTDLVFDVVVKGDTKPDRMPFIDLGMPGMDMGKNQVILAEKGKGVYTGTGVIVRCKSGRRTWRATVTVPGLGNAVFIFDVVY